jgi:hypothetical protein
MAGDHLKADGRNITMRILALSDLDINHVCIVACTSFCSIGVWPLLENQSHTYMDYV